MGGPGVGSGLVVSGPSAGAGAAGREADAATAAGAGAGDGVVVGLFVEGGVEPVDEVRGDLLAYVRWYDGAGDVVLVGPTFRGRRSMAPSGWRW